MMQLGMNQAIQAESLFSAQTAFNQAAGSYPSSTTIS